LRFTGFVLTGQLTNSIAGSNKFSLVGAMVAQDGTLGGVHQFPGDDGELVYQWDMTAQRYKDASTYFAGHGWHGGGGIEGPLLVMGEGFFVQKHGPDTNWVRTLQAEKPASLVQSSLTTPPSACDIRRFNFQDASVVLEIVNPGGVAYDVQFSRDRSSWSTISARRTGIEWKGPAPGGTYGFYRVIEAVNQ
jgi:hypothetical protein